jgi:hypothetical protein
MIGEKLGELHGKITGQRVLPAEGGRPRVETSVELSGTVMEAEITLMGTYWSTVRADGSLYGECPWQGVIMTKDGEVGIWGASGVGKFTGDGTGVSFRGPLYFQITSQKLARLNQVCTIYEWEVAGNGDADLSLWEWN